MTFQLPFLILTAMEGQKIQVLQQQQQQQVSAADIQLALSPHIQQQSPSPVLQQQQHTIQHQDISGGYTTLPIISGAVTMTTLNPHQIKITEVGQMGSLSTRKLSFMDNTTLGQGMQI